MSKLPREAIKKAGKEARVKTEAKMGRKPRTLSLDEALFRRLQTKCNNENWVVSEVVDELIEAFLAEVVD